MTVTIITDSISMPRVDGVDKIYIEETWPKLLITNLNNKGLVLAEFTGRARDSSYIALENTFNESVNYCNPDCVVIQLGIVDCAPRIVSKSERILFNRFFFPKSLRDLIIRRRKLNKNKILLRGALNRVYVPPTQFKKNLQFFIDKVNNYNSHIKIIILPILGDLENLEKVSIGYKANIEMYNKILEEFCLINNLEFIRRLMDEMNSTLFYCSDFYHINAKGHKLLANTISEFL